MKVFFPRMIDYDSICASCSKPGHRGLSDPNEWLMISYWMTSRTYLILSNSPSFDRAGQNQSPPRLLIVDILCMPLTRWQLTICVDLMSQNTVWPRDTLTGVMTKRWRVRRVGGTIHAPQLAQLAVYDMMDYRGICLISNKEFLTVTLLLSPFFDSLRNIVWDISWWWLVCYFIVILVCLVRAAPWRTFAAFLLNEKPTHHAIYYTKPSSLELYVWLGMM